MPQILFGKNPVIEAMKARKRRFFEGYLLGKRGEPLDAALAAEFKQSKIPFKIIERSQMDSLAETPHHQGVAVRVSDFPYVELEHLMSRHSQRAFFLMCDSLQDPQNFGALCRSAYCFGVDAILINKDQSVEVTPVVSKASAGAVEHLPVARLTNLARALGELKENGFWSYSTDVEQGSSLYDIDPSEKIVFVLGSEGKGVRRLIREECDFKINIPMARSFDSLNVAQAGTLICYEIAKKRTHSSSI